MKPDPRKAQRAWFWSAFNFGALLSLCLLENVTPENVWPVALLTFAPQIIFLLPTLVLAALLWRRGTWRLALWQIPALCVALFFLLDFNVPLPSRSASAPTIRVMTYNIRYGSLGIEHVIRTIRQADPEVLCVQEALAYNRFPDPTPQLERSLPDYHIARYGELLIFSRFPIVRQLRHRLPHSSDNGILEARLNAHGKIFTVFCAHFKNPIYGGVLDWPREIPRRAAIREEQRRLLWRRAARTTTPLFIAGDFNTPPRGVPYRRLASQLHDGFRKAGFGFGYSFPSFLPITRIDYLWAGKGTRVTACKVLAVRGSDHRPLLAQVEIS